MSLLEKDKILIGKMLSGDRACLAKLISKVENQREGCSSILQEISPHTGSAYIIGITGPPGAGKSTFVSCITSLFRQQGKKVGIIAVDPSSPFTGGAVLGDRIRMQDHTSDKDVFIRSIGSRGSQGGLSKATSQIVKLYDAFGFDIIIIETVGVGQTELDIISIANTVMVILVPESGDVVQTMKAGLMEIADIFVVNKADRQGAEKISKEIINTAADQKNGDGWQIPVLLTTANKGEGITQAVELIGKHRDFQLQNGLIEQKQRQTRIKEFRAKVMEDLQRELTSKLENKEFKEITEEVENGRLDPYTAAKQVTSKIIK